MHGCVRRCQACLLRSPPTDHPFHPSFAALNAEVALGGWCADAQLQAIRELPEGTSSRVSIDVNVVRDRASLEHSHTNFSLDNGTLHLSIASLAYAPNATWNPIRKLAPTYASASDVSCKLVSSDRVAEQLNLTGFFPNASKPFLSPPPNDPYPSPFKRTPHS